MAYRPLFLVLFYFFISELAIGQKRACYTHEHNQQLFEKNPGFKKKHEANKGLPSTYRLKSTSSAKTAAGPIVIPVVIHIVYHTPAENLNETQILSQLEVLNEDYSFTNADKIQVPSFFSAATSNNTDIQFCLAQRDPNGNPTSGITRTYTNQDLFFLDDPYESVKQTLAGGHDAWDATKYLNIWVCNLEPGYLGYAQFPGGDPTFDGVVISYKHFGRGGATVAPYNKGRTTTHEVGHWLGLYHIWGDDNDCSESDYVADTPNQEIENSGCPTFPSSSCSNYSDMFMNYMDYTDDGCMVMFSNGQSNRMNNTLVSSRIGLASSDGCTPTGLNVCNGQLNLTAPFGKISDGSLLNNYQNSTTCSWLIQPDNATTVSISFTEFNTESLNDTLVIYDGVDATAPVLGKYSGSSLPTTINSSGNAVFIIFKTNGTIVGQGWSLNWTSDGSIDQTTCSGTQILTGASGSFSDGSGSNYYGSNQNCSFLIQPTAPNGPTITLTFSDFDTEDNYDFVYVYRGSSATAQMIGQYSGFNLPPTLTSTAGSMFVEFISDDYINGPGFSASYNTSNSPTALSNQTTFSDFSVYPNPIEQRLTLEFQKDNEGIKTITVINNLGQKVFVTRSEDLIIEMNLENLKDGIYYLIVEQGGAIQSQPFYKLK